MRFVRHSLDDSDKAEGMVVVIDVLRAFTSACYALAASAREILLVSEVEDAFALRAAHPTAKLMGEVGGAPIVGFDYSNSPSHYIDQNLAGQLLVQRTSNGTQGVIRALHAESIVATSFVCAAATARFIQQKSPTQVSFIVTGWPGDASPPLEGDEDAACADYIEALLTYQSVDPAPFLARVLSSPTGQKFQSGTYPEYPTSDLPYCIDLDRFHFALPIVRNSLGQLVMWAERC